MIRPLVSILVALGFSSITTAGEDWPRFLGPTGAAVVKAAKIPLTWSDSDNIAWKVETPGPGSSSPIIVNDRIFVTCWSGYGDKDGAEDMTKLKRHLVCMNLADGSKVWEAVIPSEVTEDPYKGFITEHGYASSTPVSDGERVYVFFGKSGALAFEMNGDVAWQTPLGTGSSPKQWGSAASPILHGDHLIVNASDESRAIVALNKHSGEVVWKAEGGNLELAYGTPALVETDNGTEIVIGVPEELWGLNPETGKLRWFATHKLPGNISPSLIHADGIGYVFGGYPTSGSAAIKLGGKGDTTEKNLIWSTNTTSYIPTPILHEGHLYVVNDQGFAICMDAATGDEVYRERVMEGGQRGRGKPFYASPILIGDRLYCVSRTNGTFVIAAKPEFEKLATNVIALDESRFQGNPAVSGDKMILRSEKFVYCIADDTAAE